MIEGALILLAGIIIGAAATLGAVLYLPKARDEPGADDKYEKYRDDITGLLSRKPRKAG